ncbi:pyruvate dehydrogenase complex dihydrolipoamide acetyltransferase [soil metagenome]
MTEVIMPKMGDGMEEGTLIEWLKKEGDKVKSGEVIGTIQTDKATLELESPGSGTLQGILLKGGETVPVGRPIAIILKDGETLPDGWASGQGAKASEASAPIESAAAPAQAAAPAVAPTPTDDRIKASPLAKKVAAQKGIDLSSVSGTGPGGRIVEKDVQSHSTSAPIAPATQIAPATAPATIELSRLRQITAKRTTDSKQQVPHFYVTVEVDAERIIHLRQMFEEEGSGKVSVNDFVVKACALALREMPAVNSSFNGTTLTQPSEVNVGMAVALEGGLTVPVIKNADKLSLRAISAKSKELASKARDNKLALDELSGSTFAISNMGMLDVDNFVAIINQPNAAIIAIASIRKKVVVNADDELEVRSRMNITGSFDHRVVDGAIGARFVNLVRSYLENPSRLVS